MENEDRKVVTAEMLMQQVEELLLMDQLSEGEKVKILQNARPNCSDATPDYSRTLVPGLEERF